MRLPKHVREAFSQTCLYEPTRWVLPSTSRRVDDTASGEGNGFGGLALLLAVGVLKVSQTTKMAAAAYAMEAQKKYLEPMVKLLQLKKVHEDRFVQGLAN